MRTIVKRSVLASVALIWLSASAAAHHPTGGAMPATLLEGLLSGVGHPILGPDHLAFVFGIGLLAGIAGFGAMLPILFVVAMTAGVYLHVAGLDLPQVEVLIATSVILVGLAVLRPRSQNGGWFEGGAFALAGLIHGYAFAETVIGAETTPIIAYLTGLAATQLTIALGAFALARAGFEKRARLSPIAIRAAAVLIVVVGLVFAAKGTGLLA